ncbi:MAG: tryptophan synthase subunit alpha [Chitinispirillaceae bacterium]|jgi:tryptophan synthase alpha chain|nr:tryptophan synthase subunit alpha [Chitinispirillaceae bacterium]
MNRYAKTFAALKSRNEIGFIPFAVAGDPDIKTSERILRAYLDGGADILEIGYPFSDPVADGPVNQRAAGRAIAAGLDHAKFFSLMRKLRAATDVPIGLLCYANSVLHLGYDTFCKRAADAGIDSMLVADMPPEESDELRHAMLRSGIGSVFIVSELTPPDRMRMICEQTDSFVYVVSRLGATGAEAMMSSSVGATLRRLRRVTALPLAVGFGISTTEQVRAMRGAGADAAIVGSGLVALIEKHRHDKKTMIRVLTRRVAELKKATRRPETSHGEK